MLSVCWVVGFTDGFGRGWGVGVARFSGHLVTCPVGWFEMHWGALRLLSSSLGDLSSVPLFCAKLSHACWAFRPCLAVLPRAGRRAGLCRLGRSFLPLAALSFPRLDFPLPADFSCSGPSLLLWPLRLPRLPFLPWRPFAVPAAPSFAWLASPSAAGPSVTWPSRPSLGLSVASLPLAISLPIVTPCSPTRTAGKRFPSCHPHGYSLGCKGN